MRLPTFESALAHGGEVMTVHRVTHWSHKTLFGVVQVSDLFFYCRTCRCSARPLHRLLGTAREAYSTAALRLLHSHGREARHFLDQHLAGAQARTVRPTIEQPAGAAEMEVEFDGGMIPIATFEPVAVPAGQTPIRKLPKKRRISYWEEVKVGLVQVPGRTERLYTVRPTDGLETSFDDLFSLACLEGWTPQTRVRGIADGARHI